MYRTDGITSPMTTSHLGVKTVIDDVVVDAVDDTNRVARRVVADLEGFQKLDGKLAVVRRARGKLAIFRLHVLQKLNVRVNC